MGSQKRPGGHAVALCSGAEAGPSLYTSVPEFSPTALQFGGEVKPYILTGVCPG